MTTLHLGAATVCVVIGAAGGLVAPLLVRPLPEPPPLEDQPEGEKEDEDHRILREEGPKEPFAVLAGRPWFGLLATGISAVAAGLIGLGVGFEPVLIALLPMVPVLSALAIVDWRTRLLPKQLVAPSYVFVIVALLVVGLIDREPHDLIRAAIGWLVFGGFYGLQWFIAPRSMGYGDVRLAGVLGLLLGYLGWSQLLIGILVGSFAGGILGALLAVLRIVHRKGVPFGPFLLLGFVVGIAAGAPIATGLGY